jgi:hypothetical protein
MVVFDTQPVLFIHVLPVLESCVFCALLGLQDLFYLQCSALCAVEDLSLVGVATKLYCPGKIFDLASIERELAVGLDPAGAEAIGR